LATLILIRQWIFNHLGNNTWLNSSTCEEASLPPPTPTFHLWQWKSTHLLEKKKKGRREIKTPKPKKSRFKALNLQNKQTNKQNIHSNRKLKTQKL
jgi:hypothetical protein